MSALMNPAAPLTMSTREIAELLEKQHGNIKISAERLSDKGVIGTLALQEFTHNGNTYAEYMLNKRPPAVAQSVAEFRVNTWLSCMKPAQVFIRTLKAINFPSSAC